MTTEGYVTSPSGTRFPRTPGNLAEFEKDGKAPVSNKKPNLAKADVQTNEAGRDDKKLKEDVKLMNVEDAGSAGETNDEAGLEWYEGRRQEMEEQIQMMEEVLESEGTRFEEELMAEREARRLMEVQRTAEVRTMRDEKLRFEEEMKEQGAARQQYEAQRDAEFQRTMNEAREKNDVEVQMKMIEMKECELRLREREIELAEKERRLTQNASDRTVVADVAEKFESRLSISDPAGDVVGDLSMCLPLEKALQNERNSVTTVEGLLDNALTRHKALRDILESVGEFSVRFVMQRFRNKFGSMYKASKSTMSAVMILAMRDINQVKVRAAVKYAGSLELKELLEAVPETEGSGVVSVVSSSMKLKTMTELPGIVQLMKHTDGDAADNHWAGIEALVNAAMFYVKDVKLKLCEAKQKLESFDGSVYEDSNDMVAEYCRLFDVCTSWFGSDVENDFDKIQRFLKKCSVDVQMEYAEFISKPQDGVRIAEISMEWDEFESFIHSVWESSSVKLQIQAGFGILGDRDVNGSGRKKVENAGAQNSRRGTAPKDDGLDPKDVAAMSIDCIKCKLKFVCSVKQQMRCKEENRLLPDWCPKCKGQVCDKFTENGSCPFGEDCRFLHPELTEESKKNPEGPKKFSYTCRFYRVGNCKSGDNCRFQHVDEVVHNMSEADQGRRDAIAEIGWSQTFADQNFMSLMD